MRIAFVSNVVHPFVADGAQKRIHGIGTRLAADSHEITTTGRDYGWHHEPNPHVEGWGHFQQRSSAEGQYAYDSHTFSSKNPTRVVWEVMSLLTSKIGKERN